jgi:hypothetical protein
MKMRGHHTARMECGDDDGDGEDGSDTSSDTLVSGITNLYLNKNTHHRVGSVIAQGEMQKYNYSERQSSNENRKAKRSSEGFSLGLFSSSSI